MKETEKPTSFHIDLIGGNGTLFRFVWWPDEHQGTESGTIRYYDRQHTRAEGEPGYCINHMNENGQACGGPLLVSSFTHGSPDTLRGWHGIDVWDVDRGTRAMVGEWLRQVASGLGVELP